MQPNCTAITALNRAGMAKYAGLPNNYYLNYQAMVIAYNIFLRFNDMVPISFRAFRIHRVLGFGNTQTLLGIINGPTGQW